MNLNHIERLVYNAIPAGRKRAISKEELGRATGLPVRRAREVVEHLVTGHGLLIGSSTERDRGGYYRIVDEEDFGLAVRHLKPRAVSIFRRLAALERAGALKFDRQLRLFSAEVFNLASGPEADKLKILVEGGGGGPNKKK